MSQLWRTTEPDWSAISCINHYEERLPSQAPRQWLQPLTIGLRGQYFKHLAYPVRLQGCHKLQLWVFFNLQPHQGADVPRFCLSAVLGLADHNPCSWTRRTLRTISRSLCVFCCSNCVIRVTISELILHNTCDRVNYSSCVYWGWIIEHSLHGKTAASVLLKLFISGNERCHTTDAP